MSFDWAALVAFYGPAALPLALLLWLFFDQRKELREERERAAKQLEQALPALSESTAALAASSKVLERVTSLPSPEQVARLIFFLERAERRLEDR
ncbi:MAG TPA: hypothetical protein VGB14_00455 [Acidimicrobiales bacterium]